MTLQGTLYLQNVLKTSTNIRSSYQYQPELVNPPTTTVTTPVLALDCSFHLQIMHSSQWLLSLPEFKLQITPVSKDGRKITHKHCA